MSLLRQLLPFAFSLFLASPALAQQLPVPPTLAAKSWLLLEMGSGQVLTAEKPDERLEPASLTKLMTAYLTFAALQKKTITLEQSLPVSQKAWKTGGSKMFVRVDTQVPVDDLIKGMIVQSGNDACVTLAEGIAGSEENFAQMMNREAQRLGMKSSSFTNSTGLPDPNLYTTAHDLSLLAGALIALGAIAWELATNLDDGALKQVEAALSGLLLVFILIELLGAVRATIIEQKLVAEPFLVVGIIAAIKGILVGSLEAGTKSGDALEDAMVEVVGLGLLVLFLALAAFLVRRKEREPTERDG